MLSITVKLDDGCLECPLSQIDWWDNGTDCQYQCAGDPIEKRVIDDTSVPPEWCPLRSSDVPGEVVLTGIG